MLKNFPFRQLLFVDNIFWLLYFSKSEKTNNHMNKTGGKLKLAYTTYRIQKFNFSFLFYFH